MSVLDKVNSPEDVKLLQEKETASLCEELREFLIKSVSKTGGHLAANLGVVELTIAIHKVFDTARDKLVFDVGHQSYVHKLLTGRKEQFCTLRQFGGLSGFPKRSESVHDAFIAGHASTSVSAALGIARARTLSKSDYSVIALIGDGALTGGLAYEGLSDAGGSGEPMIIILNDNGMSITKNVGGVARYLSRQRMKPSYSEFKRRYKKIMDILPGGGAVYRFTHHVKQSLKDAILKCSMFEDMGLQYSGPINGHDVSRVVEALEWARRQNSPTVVHVLTQKGKGYEHSELEPAQYHGVKPFDHRVGVIGENGKTFSSVFGESLLELASCEPRICAITASMTEGTGLSAFSTYYPDRFFDVGIAEEHATVMAAGMASRGAIPVFAVYSSFLQRSYDMLIHDIAISHEHVILAVDRAGLVPGDGETHQGVFDVAFLRSVPGMTVLCPSSYNELSDMLLYAVEKVNGPVAVRFPRGTEGAYKAGGAELVKCVRAGKDFTLVTHGISINTALEAADNLSHEGIFVEIIKLGAINPIDMSSIAASVAQTGRLLVLEECVGKGSVGEAVVTMLAQEGLCPKTVVLLNTGEGFAPCGEVDQLRKLCGIDTQSVCAVIREKLRAENDTWMIQNEPVSEAYEPAPAQIELGDDSHLSMVSVPYVKDIAFEDRKENDEQNSA